jgi:transposase
MAGRPTKLTPDVQELIVDGINAGLTYGMTCARAGVTYATFYNWLKKGEVAKSGVLMEFFDAVSRAKADSALRLVSQITLQAPTDWRAAAFMLERRFPDDYGKRTEVTGKDGGPVKVEAKTQHIFQPTQEVWDEILRKRAEFETLRDGDTDEDTSFDSL